jgi:dTDP-4-dehydrorhamnose 3,5-epimerase
MPIICDAEQANMGMVERRRLQLDGLVELRPERHFDDRGFFSEVWRDDWLGEIGARVPFVQDNHVFSSGRGVLRGLHFQIEPAAQDKLVRVTQGSIYDVAVDIRANSPTFGKWEGIVISAEAWNQLFVPRGFAHGYVVLEENTVVLYKVSAPYAPQLDRSIRFDDPAIGIEWPIEHDALIVSERDRAAPLLSEIEESF